MEEGIKFYTEMYILMRDEIEAGTLSVADLADAAKESKEVMATIQREDELAAIKTLAYLRASEQDSSERARELMAKQLVLFVDAEFPSTESSQRIREKILEYAQSSPSLARLKPQSEQDGAVQPATAPQSKPEGDETLKPESERRSQ